MDIDGAAAPGNIMGCYILPLGGGYAHKDTEHLCALCTSLSVCHAYIDYQGREGGKREKEGKQEREKRAKKTRVESRG